MWLKMIELSIFLSHIKLFCEESEIKEKSCSINFNKINKPIWHESDTLWIFEAIQCTTFFLSNQLSMYLYTLKKESIAL